MENSANSLFWICIRKIYHKIADLIMRVKLKNKDFSILTPTCIGGVISHRLGRQFLSPTINLWLTEDDFYIFIMDLKWYIKAEVEFSHIDETYNFPVGVIHGRDRSPKSDIYIFFNHHKDFKSAVNDWNKRKKRINWNNIYIVASSRGGCETNEKIERWNNAYSIAKGIVCFTADDYPDIPYALQITAFKGEDCCGPYMTDKISKYLRKLPYERDFNYVRWLNTGEVKK